MFYLLDLSLCLLCTTDVDLQELFCRTDPSEMSELLNL